MKKLLALAAAVIMCLCAAIPANADSRSDLASACAVANQSCPMDLGDGMMMKSIKLVNNNVVFTFVMPFSKDELQVFKSMESEFVGVLYESLRTDKDVKTVFNLCKSAHCNLVIRLTNKQGSSVDLTLPYTKM